MYRCIDVEVDIHGYSGLKGATKSVQALLRGIEAAMVLTLTILKQ